MQSMFCRAVLLSLVILNFLGTAYRIWSFAARFRQVLPAFIALYVASYVLLEGVFVVGFVYLYKSHSTAWFRERLRG